MTFCWNVPAALWTLGTQKQKQLTQWASELDMETEVKEEVTEMEVTSALLNLLTRDDG